MKFCGTHGYPTLLPGTQVCTVSLSAIYQRPPTALALTAGAALCPRACINAVTIPANNMGVQRLLPLLGPLCRTTNFFLAAAGRVIGVDGHVWLHHFAYACAEDIVERGDYEPLANMFVQRCQYVKGHGVHIVLVFDGGSMPAKAEEEAARARRQASQYARQTWGDRVRISPQANQAATKITSVAVRAVVSKLREKGFPYVVAPYEADAQLAWLSQEGHIWAALTVDTDLVIHGVQRTFFKIDLRRGDGYLVTMDHLLGPDRWPDTPQYKTSFLSLLKAWGADFLLAYALVSGCDYDTKVAGIGSGRSIQALHNVSERHGLSLSGLPRETMEAIATELVTLGGNAEQAESWPDRAAQATLAFKHPLIYDISLQIVTTKDGQDAVVACNAMPFLGAPIPAEQAADRAAGALDPAGERHELPAMSVLVSVAMPSRLSADMIRGAVLPRMPVRANNMAVLHRWLDTRHGLGDMGMSTARKEDLVHVIEQRMEVEAAMEDRGDMILLRDPDGRSLQRIILDLHPAEHWHFPEVTHGVQLPVEGWISELEVIKETAPLMDPLVWVMHWSHTRVTSAPGSRTLLDDAYQRVKEMPQLLEFAYHPSGLPGPDPFGGGQQRCLFRGRMPASMRSTSHLVWMEASVVRLRGLRPRVHALSRARCTCAIGTSCTCVHLAMLMMIVHNLPRPFGRAGETEGAPVTSRLCRWNQPGEGEMYPVNRPLAYLPFVRESHLSMHDAEDSTTRVVQCSSSDGFRMRYDPRADKDKEPITDPATHAARQARRQRLWDLIAEAEGEMCAAEVTYGIREEESG